MALSHSQLFADVSSNNGHVSIPAYASSGYVALAIKATEGLNYVNPFYHDQVVECHRHNMPVLHYHFAHPEENPHDQADHFWDTIRQHTVRPGDFLVVDLEIGQPSQNWLDAFYGRLFAVSGYKAILYTYLSYYDSGRLISPSGKVWMAAYGSTRPGRLWSLGRGQQLWAWQYTDGHGFGPGPQSFAGIAGTSDGSWMNPSVARALRKQKNPK